MEDDRIQTHSMPALGWKDQLLYWTVMLLTAGFPLYGVFIVEEMQDRIAFSDPLVIAGTVGQGYLNCVWMLLWCLVAFAWVFAGMYQFRKPIFGRTDIKYGPPKYPDVYPVFMKNKPYEEVNEKEVKKRKQFRLMVISMIMASFVFCAAMFPLSFYGRAVLRRDGTVIVYDAHNQEVNHYTIDDIAEIRLDTYRSGTRGRSSWHICYRIQTMDSESYNFAAHSFSGTELQQLQNMLYVKEKVYKERCLISGTENLENVVWDQYKRSEEKEFLYQLFEVNP